MVKKRATLQREIKIHVPARTKQGFESPDGGYTWWQLTTVNDDPSKTSGMTASKPLKAERNTRPVRDDTSYSRSAGKRWMP